MVQLREDIIGSDFVLLRFILWKRSRSRDRKKGPEQFDAWTLISERCRSGLFCGIEMKAYYLRQANGSFEPSVRRE
jgi:hypothetical protein